MPIVDEHGNPVDPAKVQAYLKSGRGRFASYPVATPAEVGSKLTRNLSPLAAQTAGGEIGGVLGSAVGGVPGAIAGDVIGSGLGGLASKYFPRELGGNPEESKVHAFLSGAVPGGVGRAGGALLERQLARRTAQAMEGATKEFEEGAERIGKEVHRHVDEALKAQRATPEQVEQLKNAIGKTGSAPWSTDVTSPQGQQEAFSVRDAILDPIDLMRERLGAPLGAAYRSLKGTEQISEQEAQDIADAAQSVRDEALAPYPKAAQMLSKLKNLLQGPNTAAITSSMERQGYDQNIIRDFLSAQAERPNLDQLRDFRQQVNEALRGTARGGDIHALRDLQQALDQHMMQHLPSNIQAMRGSYAHFMNNYPWREIRSLRRIGTPQEMAGWLFDKKAPQTLEIISAAGPKARALYGRAFYNHILDSVDESLPAAQQMAQIAKATLPYRKNGVAAALFGGRAAQVQRDLIYMPVHLEEFGKLWNDPVRSRTWTDEFIRAARTSGKADQAAAQEGFQAWMNTLSPQQQRTFRQLAINQTGPAEPVALPGPKQAVSQAIVTKAAKPRQALTSRLQWAIPMGLTGVMLGRKFGATYSASVAMTVGAMMAGREAYRGFIDAGGADLLGALYGTPAGRASGAAAFRAFVRLGGRVAHQETQ